MSENSTIGTGAVGAGKAARQAAQRQRLAAALRENLRRRKAKAKASVATTDAPGGRGAPAASHDSAGIAEDKQSQ